MALTRSAGARRDATRGTVPIEVRKAAAIRWATTGVTAGSTTPLVVGTAGFAYSVGAAGFVTSRGASDGVHEFTNDGPLSITCPAAPGSGLSRVDVIWTRHPTAGENGDTTSEPILGVSSGAAVSSNPAVPTIPTGALELARNTMTSAATTTASAGNLIAQTAGVANLRGAQKVSAKYSVAPTFGATVPAGTELTTLTGPFNGVTGGGGALSIPFATVFGATFPTALVSVHVQPLNGFIQAPINGRSGATTSSATIICFNATGVPIALGVSVDCFITAVGY